MDLGLNWVDFSTYEHNHDIGLEWVDLSEPHLSHDIGIEWVDISEPELNADIGLEWVDMSETKLDGEIGLEWHDIEMEEMHIEPGPCDCDNLGDAMLLQEEGHFDDPLVEHYQPRTAHNLANAMTHDLHWNDNHYDTLQHHDHAEIEHDLYQGQDDRLGGEIHAFHESLSDFFPNGEPYFPEPINLMQEMN